MNMTVLGAIKEAIDEARKDDREVVHIKFCSGVARDTVGLDYCDCGGGHAVIVLNGAEYKHVIAAAKQLREFTGGIEALFGIPVIHEP